MVAGWALLVCGLVAKRIIFFWSVVGGVIFHFFACRVLHGKQHGELFGQSKTLAFGARACLGLVSEILGK